MEEKTEFYIKAKAVQKSIDKIVKMLEESGDKRNEDFNADYLYGVLKAYQEQLKTK